jgi:hypothetical protein
MEEQKVPIGGGLPPFMLIKVSNKYTLNYLCVLHYKYLKYL